MSVCRVAAAGALTMLLVSCATTTQKYNWGKYDPALYGYYKDPSKVGELSQTLEAIIKSADGNRAKVPPGICAEFGYLQLQQGRSEAAVALFKQEQASWPESKVFMDHMIQAAMIPAAGSSPVSPKP